jgi:hypothetical protein
MAAVAVEANHSRGNQFVAHRSNQKQLRLFRELARDVGVWIVPWAGEAAFLPESDNGGLIVRLKGSDLHLVDDAINDDRSHAGPRALDKHERGLPTLADAIGWDPLCREYA